jgi:hypothetical protein
MSRTKDNGRVQKNELEKKIGNGRVKLDHPAGLRMGGLTTVTVVNNGVAN